MVKVSIISLIYQSSSFADWIYDSVKKYTPYLDRGVADFFFVANDPTPRLLGHLQKRNIPHIVHRNRQYSNEELFAHGFGKPEYMSRVYRGYNRGILEAKGDYVILVNSDNFFSPDWLENLLKYHDRQSVISSKLVERKHPKYELFPGALLGEFGNSVSNFQEKQFIEYSMRIKQTGLEAGGAYMPSLFHKDLLIEAGLYPEGNIAGENFDTVRRYGDEELFDHLAALGIRHYTALDSIVYHMKEGEKDELEATDSPVDIGKRDEQFQEFEKLHAYPNPQAITRSYYSIDPTVRHKVLMQSLTGKPKLKSHYRTHHMQRQLLHLLYLTLKSLGLLNFTKEIVRCLQKFKKYFIKNTTS